MTKLITLLLIITCIFLKAQDSINNPYNFNCENFDISVSGNLRMNIQFASNELFNYIKEDSISIPKRSLNNQDQLWKDFNSNFKGKITKHCINSKILQDEKIASNSFCNEKSKITIVDKIDNYFIFNLKAFEIDNHILFNTKNKVAYFFKSFPIILNGGKTIIDIELQTVYNNGIDIYEFENDIPKTSNISFPRQYNLQKSYIIKDWKNNIKVLFDLIRYDLKEITSPEEPFNRKYDYDKDKSCRKLIVISK